MLATPPFGASSNIALWRANNKPPVELVVVNLYDKTVEIVPASDVFQMAAIFWFVVNNRFPLGIVTHKDWKREDKDI